MYDGRCYTRYDLKRTRLCASACAEVLEDRRTRGEGGKEEIVRDIYICIQIDESRGNEEPATLLDTIN